MSPPSSTPTPPLTLDNAVAALIEGDGATAHAIDDIVDPIVDQLAALPGIYETLVAAGLISSGLASEIVRATGVEATKAAKSSLAAETTRATGAEASLSTALTAKADLVGGIIPTSQLPAIAVVTVVYASTQAEMLAFTPADVQPGDVCLRSDGSGSFMLVATNPAVVGSWKSLDTRTDVVTLVNGQLGVVVLGKADIGLPNVDNTSDINKPLSTAQSSAISTAVTGLARLASPTFTGTVSGITKTMVGLGSVDNTADVGKPVSTAQATALALKADAILGGTVSSVYRYPTADTAMPDQVQTLIPLGVTGFKRGTLVADETANVITATVAGMYQFNAEIDFNGGAAGSRTGIFMVNTSSVRQFGIAIASSAEARVSGSMVYPLNAGDKVGLQIWIAGAGCTVKGGPGNTGLTVTRLGA